MYMIETKERDTKQETINLANYDKIIVAFSGGKDSLACLLHLIELGVKDHLEIWHHAIDGKEGSDLMDWACTEDYCRKVAAAFDIPYYLQWKEGGFEREMLRNDQPTAPTKFETPDGVMSSGGKGSGGTRRKFPQISPNLSVRWCSSYLKIDVCASAIRNQKRFNEIKTLVVTGERAEESAARAKYLEFETHRAASKKRQVDHWRPVLQWKEQAVWDIIERHKVNPHPAYRLGWGRVSCAGCIFGSKNQWASLKKVNPEQFEKIAGYEREFGLTINRSKPITELAKAGQAYDMQQYDIMSALSSVFEESVFVETWELPAGAFGESCGPT